MKFDNWPERLMHIKDVSPKLPCTFGDDNDREGFYWEVRDYDFEWLYELIDAQRKIIESYSRITGDMADDYNRLRERYEEQQKAVKEPVEFVVKSRGHSKKRELYRQVFMHNKQLGTNIAEKYGLTDKQMEVVEKYFLTDKTLVQVADELGISTGAVTDRVKAVYNRLKPNM